MQGVRSETIWGYQGHGGESELIATLLPPGAEPEELQPLANCARDVLVFHNEFRSTPRAILHPPVANCTADGWGRAAADPAREVRRRNLSVARRKERQRRRDVQDVCLHLAGSPQAFPVL